MISSFVAMLFVLVVVPFILKGFHSRFGNVKREETGMARHFTAFSISKVICHSIIDASRHEDTSLLIPLSEQPKNIQSKAMLIHKGSIFNPWVHTSTFPTINLSVVASPKILSC